MRTSLLVEANKCGLHKNNLVQILETVIITFRAKRKRPAEATLQRIWRKEVTAEAPLLPQAAAS